MYGNKDATIKNLNSYIDELKQSKNKKNIRFSLLRFNSTKLDMYYDKAKLKNVKKIKDYNPNSLTPLYDAIGHLISNMPENATESVLVVLTDGWENSSQEYNIDSIKKLIESKKELGWKFVFLAAGITEQAAYNLSTQGKAMAFNITYSGILCDSGLNDLSKSAKIETRSYVDNVSSNTGNSKR
jgi:hypothetical protein